MDTESFFFFIMDTNDVYISIILDIVYRKFNLTMVNIAFFFLHFNLRHKHINSDFVYYIIIIIILLYGDEMERVLYCKNVNFFNLKKKDNNNHISSR